MPGIDCGAHRARATAPKAMPRALPLMESPVPEGQDRVMNIFFTIIIKLIIMKNSVQITICPDMPRHSDRHNRLFENLGMEFIFFLSQ